MLKNHKFYKNIIWLIILFSVPLPLIVLLGNGINQVYLSSITAINLGLMAYTWMLSAIYLATKPKWLDRLIGLPDMYLIHGVTTVFALVLMYIHKYSLPSAGLVELTGEFSLYLITGLIIYSLVFMAGWLTSRVRILLIIKKKLEKIFKHEITVWIHRLNLVAVAVIYIHVLVIDYIREVTPFILAISSYTIFTFINYFIYLYKKTQAYEGVLVGKKLIDNTIIQLDIQLPKKFLRNIKAGEFAFISFPSIKELTEPHPFSIVNVPSRDGYVRFGIDMVGDFTKQLKTLKQYEKVSITRSYGVLHNIFENSVKDDKFVLIGGGIGITSLMSLADNFSNKDISFLYSVRAEKNFLYQDKFEEFARRSNFRSLLNKGRFKEEDLEKALPIGEEYNYIIAGPMAMNISYTKYLKEKGIKDNKIFFESFNF